MKKSFLIALSGFLLFGYGYWLYRGSREALALSPGLMPMLLGGMTLLLSAFSKGDWIKGEFPLSRGLLILLYFVVWNVTGFWPSTLCFCFVAFYFFAGKKVYPALAYSFALTLSMDLLFVRFFSILLP